MSAVALPYGTSLPTNKTDGAVINYGNLLIISAEVAAGTGDCNLYRWVPELNKFRKYSSNPMTITADLQLSGKYLVGINETGYYYLLVPNGVTLTDPLIWGAFTR